VTIWAVILSVLLGLAVNESCELSPWAAKKITRWSARLRNDDPERARIRSEEWLAVIEDVPGKLFKFITALCFAADALRAWARRAVARLSADVPVVSSGGTVAVKKAAIAVAAGTVAFAVVFAAEPVISRGLSGVPVIQQAAPRAGGPSVSQAAGTLAALLAQGSHESMKSIGAWDDVTQCGPHLKQDAQVFRNAAADRRALIMLLRTMHARSALPAPMLQDLEKVWQAYAVVDGDDAQWADDETAHACAVNDQSDPALQAAIGPGSEARAEKAAFAASWDPLAVKYGLTEYQWYDL
jgi:hypothetical protein